MSKETKICSKCGKRKAISQFIKCGRGRHGVRGECKLCKKEYDDNYRKEFPERRTKTTRDAWKKRTDNGKLKEWRSTNKEKRNEYLKDWAKKNPDKVRGQKLRHKYGISLEEYNKILLAQNGVCAVCSATDVGVKGRKNLFVDHCHETGKIRGLLCHKCNITVKDIEHVKNVLKYLKGSSNV